MKILHIPPEYLDNATLLIERSVLNKLFFKISDELYSPNDNDRMLQKFYTHHQFIFLRLDLIIEELEERGFEIQYDENEYLPEIQESQEYEISVEDISRDIDFIYAIWQEYLSYDSMIPSLIEKLSLSNSEELCDEMNRLIDKQKKEYGL